MDTETETLHFTVGESEASMRLDAFLAHQDDRHSRSRYKALILSDQVMINGKTCREPKYRISIEQEISVTVPPAEAAEPEAENIPLTIVHEDNQLIVVNKAAGMVVHPAVGNWSGTLVNALLYHCGDSLSGIGGVKRPGIVHRLDKETSGLMVVAKTDLAHKILAAQFADHGRKGALIRSYQALVWGAVHPSAGRIETMISRSSSNRLKMAVHKLHGKIAITHYQTLETYPPGMNAQVSLIECRLETGRTHQIRVHLAHKGNPLLGDPEYGQGFKTKISHLSESAALILESFRRQALHACELGFKHPETREILQFRAEPPEDFALLQAALKKNFCL